MNGRSASDPDRSAEGGSARYGRHTTGSNEPKHSERKEQRPDWIHRQGGDQTRSGDEPRRPDAPEKGAR
jgi:hypothetical protein